MGDLASANDGTPTSRHKAVVRQSKIRPALHRVMARLTGQSDGFSDADRHIALVDWSE